MFCRPQSGNTLESKGGVEMGETILLGLGWIPQSETPPLKNEAPLYCVALRSSLDYEVAWRACRNIGEKNKAGRHVGLDFYDLLIEAHLKGQRNGGYAYS